MVKNLCENWRNHRLMSKWMYKFFGHLDRGYAQYDDRRTITSCSLNLFHDEVFMNINDSLFPVVLSILDRFEEEEIFFFTF